jgi:hypothetical protein
MNHFSKIIDNKRKKLLDSFIELSPLFDVISIATGYWDLLLNLHKWNNKIG